MTRWERFKLRLGRLLASSDETYCDGCKRFSRGPCCPHCRRVEDVLAHDYEAHGRRLSRLNRLFRRESGR